MNQLMSDKAVYGTAPDTPGLLTLVYTGIEKDLWAA